MDIELDNIDMDEIIEALENDYYWHLPTNDIQPNENKIEIPEKMKADYIQKFIDYTVNNCKVKRIQDYYIVKCAYCDTVQYKAPIKPLFEGVMITCINLKCKKIFYY